MNSDNFTKTTSMCLIVFQGNTLHRNLPLEKVQKWLLESKA